MDRPQFEKAKSIRIQFQNQYEPIQGDTVKPLPINENKMDTFDNIENSLTFMDIVLAVPKIIGHYFNISLVFNIKLNFLKDYEDL